MGDVDAAVNEALERAGGSGLNAIVAVLVALAATCMALDNIKDGNIGQGMAQAQAKMVDSWSYYQAKSTKENLAQATLDQLLALQDVAVGRGARSPELERRITSYRDEVARYEREKAGVRTEAEGYQREYDALNLHDDQFDLSDAAFSIGIALLGVTALTRKRWLLGLACVFLGLGLLFGLAGFLGWSLHPDRMMPLLS